MFDDEISYHIESEIDKAFPYLDTLNNELDRLKKESSMNCHKKKKFSFLDLFRNIKNQEEKIVANNTKYIRSKRFNKDGYVFIVRLNLKYNEELSSPSYYEFFINIKYSNEKRNKEFYRIFFAEDKAKRHYKDWEGMLRHLTRRDIMERLFKEKLNEIEKYNKNNL